MLIKLLEMVKFNLYSHFGFIEYEIETSFCLQLSGSEMSQKFRLIGSIKNAVQFKHSH